MRHCEHTFWVLACVGMCGVAATGGASSVRVHASLAAPVGGISHHSSQLMGITAYGDPNFQEESAQALVQELGIKSIGLMTTVTSMAPKGLTVSELESWFATPTNGTESTALRHLRQSNPNFVALIESQGVKKAGAVQWTYLCHGNLETCNDTAADGHCLAHGTPATDALGSWAWWEVLFVGSFRTLRSLDSSLKYLHLWNEPNAHFWKDGKNGTWYADMFVAVATALKKEFPDVLIGGPVTYNPPIHQVKGQKPGLVDGSVWKAYFEPVLERTSGLDLLDWMDFHAYQFSGTVDASGDVIQQNLIQIAEKASVRAAISETNFPLEITQTAWEPRWTIRGLGLADQTMALLRNPDKVLTRQLFDWGVPAGDSKGNKGAFRFLPDNETDPWTPEMELFKAFRGFSGGLRVNVSKVGSSQLQAEAVCISSESENVCRHLKLALVNTALTDELCAFEIFSISSECKEASLVQLAPKKPGPTRTTTNCSAANISIPAQGMAIVECIC